MANAGALTVLQSDPRWRGHKARVARAARAVKPPGAIAIQLADDAAVQALNAQFRGKNKPTNVLSFPDGEEGRLGDIILAYETIAREAEAQGKQFADHVSHLVVHGVLHLMGYDHETDTDATAMEHKEVIVLRAMGIANPYE